MSVRFLLQLFLITASLSNVFAMELKSLNLKEHGEKIVVELLANGWLDYKTFVLPNPERVIIDFKQTNTKINLQNMLTPNALIARIRSGKPNPYDLRLVFDMKQPVLVHTTSSAHGLRIELGKKQFSRLPASKLPPVVHASRRSRMPIQVHHSPARKLRDVVIVLDPGHGGKDPGAIGPRRNAEKNVTLAIAFKLKQMIDRQVGMRAVLTRKGDYYVGLRERLNIARKYNGDVFISIHADAFINQHSSGVSVFALSQNGATSEAARWLAEKENYSELGGVNLSDLDDNLVRTVLIDLSQTATIGASLQMGSKVLQHLDQITNLHNNKVEQARFVVLKSPDIPSILIETGFITNPREERNLTSSAYQIKLTQAILSGLKRYFWDYPPQGTRMEALAFVNTNP